MFSTLHSSLKHTNLAMHLQDATHLLVEAQAMEDKLLQAAQARYDIKSDVPAPPLLLSRTQDSVALTHRPFKLKSHKKAAFFAVYAKNFGAGVGLGMNSTSMELEGTGQQQPLEARVTISGYSKQCYHVARWDFWLM